VADGDGDGGDDDDDDDSDDDLAIQRLSPTTSV
jgi:hypothetical protein